MLAFAIDRGDRFRKGHAALLSDLFQTVPELVFKADAQQAFVTAGELVEETARGPSAHGE